MLVEPGDLREQLRMAERARTQYKFRSRLSDGALARHLGGNGVEVLVDGEWVRIVRPTDFYDERAWVAADDDGGLAYHALQCITSDLDRERLRWSSFKARLTRTAGGRLVVPPLAGGAARSPDEEDTKRCRNVFLSCLSRLRDDEVKELHEQAQEGYELQRERNATVEQRANFFLGAAGLSSTLVLANASILLGAGEGALGSPWRQLSAAAFALASVCAIVAGIRALQAVMLSFERVSPSGVGPILEADSASGGLRATRNHTSFLLLAQERELRVHEWKLARLGEARRWFGGAVLGVVVVTAFVLVEVL